jgi:hypothetical protein
MRITPSNFRATLLTLTVFALLSTIATSAPAQNKKLLETSPKIASAKTLYFENQTGNAAVGNKALAELQKWGRFKIVDDPNSADIAILLTALRYSSGMIVFGKQLGTDADTAPPEFAYLTVVDPSTKESLYTDSCRWGGLLTGVNGAGARLVKKFKQQLSK